MTEVVTLHNPPLECEVDGKPALCMAWYDYGYWLPTQWKCVIKKTRKIVFAEHMRITMKDNWTSGVGFKPLPHGVLDE